MRIILLAGCICLLSAGAQAATRYNIGSMSCAQTQALVRNQGAVILRWKSPTSGAQLFDRFVNDDRFCPTGQEARRFLVPTADARSCVVYNCQQIQRDRFKRRWLWDD